MDKLQDCSTLKENFQEQLSELEMLQSVFCNPGEIVIDDYNALADIHDYINNKTKLLPSLLNYTVNLNIDDIKISINISLPHKYPHDRPEILIRINNQNRTQQQNLNTDLKDFISHLDSGEICIFSIITWLQENVLNYIKENSTQTRNEKESKNTCARFWIYSHHIYNKTKRRDILNLASDYSLTGFCLPGKPGIVCIEGNLNDCNSWWSYIRNLTWKKIMCKKIETNDELDINNFRKFSSFEEIAFQSENVRSTHMDMGEFYGYLERHNCEYMFKEIFGVDSKTM